MKSAPVRSPSWWAAVRLAGGVAVLAVVAWRLGTGPFVEGISTITAGSLLAAAAIGVLTTVCCAWRWTMVAGGLGVSSLPLRPAVAAYYRSQFLNTTLPGGVLGDVDRGLTHGRDVADVGLGLRAVGWERAAGQLVQMALTVAVLLVFPSPGRALAALIAWGLLAAGCAAVLLARHFPDRDAATRKARVRKTVTHDVRFGLLGRQVWPKVLIASAVVVAGHCATFLIAARVAGSTASTASLLPIALVVLAAMALPVNIGGWGPREGAAAWAFGAAGLGAAQGVSAAVVYGVMSVVTSLPGAAVLAVGWRRRNRASRNIPRLDDGSLLPAGLTMDPGGAPRG